MITRKKCICTSAQIVFALLLSTNIFAGEYSSGSSSVLGLGQSVRSAALGSTVGSVSGDASGALWNPALLSSLSRQSFVVSHLRLFESSELSFASWGGEFDGFGSVGVSVMRFGAESFPEVRNYTETGGTVDFSTVKVALSYSRELGDRFSFGVSGLVVAEELFESRDAGFGADIGLLYSGSRVTIGAALQNAISPKIQIGSRGERLNRIAVFGASLNRLSISSDLSLTLAGDLHLEEARDPGGHGGVELDFRRRLSVRAGVNRGELTFGAGIPLGDLTVDYAYEALGELDGSHRFGFSMAFGSTADERAKIRLSRNESIGRAFAAHDRQARASSAFASAERFMQSAQSDSAAVYYQLALALEPGHQPSSQGLALARSALDLRQRRLDSLANLAGEESDGSGDSNIGSILAVVRHLIEQERFSAAESALSSLSSHESALSSRPDVDSLRSELNAKKAEWLTISLANANRAESSGSLFEVFEIYSSLNREYPSNASYKTELGEISGKLKSQDLLDQAESAFGAQRYDEARSSVSAALALDPENGLAQELLDKLNSKLSSGGLDEISANPGDWETMSEALRLVRVGELEKALGLFDQLLLKYPNNNELLRNKSQVELRIHGDGGE